jgi:hypothetical protein
VKDTIKDDTGDFTTAEIQEYIEDCFEVEGEYLYTTTGARVKLMCMLK